MGGRLEGTAAGYVVGLGGGAVPWAHFSILPSTPQAVSASEIGIANWPRPGTADTSVPSNPARPPALGLAVTDDSSAVISEPPMPSAVFLPSSILPMVSPSAPLTWPRTGLPSRLSKVPSRSTTCFNWSTGAGLVGVRVTGPDMGADLLTTEKSRSNRLIGSLVAGSVLPDVVVAGVTPPTGGRSNCARSSSRFMIRDISPAD